MILYTYLLKSVGEERMRVVWHQRRRGDGNGGSSKDDDEVVFEVLSIARGSGLLGRLVFPFNRGMQVSWGLCYGIVIVAFGV